MGSVRNRKVFGSHLIPGAAVLQIFCPERSQMSAPQKNPRWTLVGSVLLDMVTLAEELCYDHITAPIQSQSWEQSDEPGWPQKHIVFFNL